MLDGTPIINTIILLGDSATLQVLIRRNKLQLLNLSDVSSLDFFVSHGSLLVGVFDTLEEEEAIQAHQAQASGEGARNIW